MGIIRSGFLLCAGAAIFWGFTHKDQLQSGGHLRRPGLDHVCPRTSRQPTSRSSADQRRGRSAIFIGAGKRTYLLLADAGP